MSTTLYIVLPVLLAAGVFWLRPRKTWRLPPGPSRTLWGDNRKDVPVFHPWKTFATWKEKYGPVSLFYFGRTPTIVLNTVKAATDLLEKRGNIYSSRPRNIMGGELLSGGMRGIGMPYGRRWRNWRALMHVGMGVEACQEYKALQSVESRVLLRDLYQENDVSKYSSHLRRFAISIVFSITYGKRAVSLEDERIAANQKTEEYFVKVYVPGRYIVESWPFLLYLPRPLQWFRKEPEAQRAKDTELYMSLMSDVRQQMERGVAQPSIATRALSKQAEFGLNDVETAFALSAPWAAGVGTTTATIEVFIMAMLHYPEIMRKAQSELDSVIGQESSPDFKDSDSLPYVNAVLKETTRWRSIAPLGFPHSVTTDDVYEGMYIPKASTIYPNIYAMTRDPEMFPEPDVFRPERFLDPDNKELQGNFTLPFGFGRRICPGLHIATNSAFIVIVRLLWAFDILPALNERGEPELPPSDNFTVGLIIRPTPFKYRLKPRKEGLAASILADAERAELEGAAWS